MTTKYRIIQNKPHSVRVERLVNASSKKESWSPVAYPFTHTGLLIYEWPNYTDAVAYIHNKLKEEKELEEWVPIITYFPKE